MDDSQVAEIMRIFPACPEEVARIWLAPYIDDIGMPRSEGRWFYILGGRPVDFWKAVNWTREQTDFSSRDSITADCARCLNQMYRAYFEGEQNAFAAIENGQARTLRAMVYLREHRTLPGPLVAIQHSENSPLEIVDGNHRLLAYQMGLKMPFEFEKSQAVWVCRY